MVAYRSAGAALAVRSFRTTGVPRFLPKARHVTKTCGVDNIPIVCDLRMGVRLMVLGGAEWHPVP